MEELEMGVGSILDPALFPPPSYRPSTFVNWTYKGLLFDGIDFTPPDIGGPDCINVIPFWRRTLESVLSITFFIVEVSWMWPKLSWPSSYEPRPHNPHIRAAVLGFLCLIFGIEVGYKVCSQTVIYLFYPCHMLTLLQIVLLAIPNDNWVACFLFRMNIYAMNGPIIALLFPVLHTLYLPLEKEWYFVQHYTILLVPFYLMTLGGAYTVEPLANYDWAITATAFTMLYHLLPMQALAHMQGTQINLSTVLCPAVSDPIGAPWWRTASFFHQHLSIPLFGKLACLLARFLFSVSQSMSGVFAYENGQEHVPPTRSDKIK